MLEMFGREQRKNEQVPATLPQLKNGYNIIVFSGCAILKTNVKKLVKDRELPLFGRYLLNFGLFTEQIFYKLDSKIV